MTHEIELNGRVQGGALLEFVSLIMPVQRERYVPLFIVRYALNGQLQKYGLRFDLDKRGFADHFLDNDAQEQVLQAAIPKIVEIASTEIRRQRFAALNREFGKE